MPMPLLRAKRARFIVPVLPMAALAGGLLVSAACGTPEPAADAVNDEAASSESMPPSAGNDVDEAAGAVVGASGNDADRQGVAPTESDSTEGFGPGGAEVAPIDDDATSDPGGDDEGEEPAAEDAEGESAPDEADAPPADAPPADAPPADAPPADAPPVVATDSRCVGIPDAGFNLDVERPRGDPPPRDGALPALFVVGDSTVKNHNVQQEGWGDLLDRCFDASRFQVINWAREGRSTRSFIEDGLWTKVLGQMRSGDYVMVQFGHNDQSTLDTRGTIAGAGEESQVVVSTTTGLGVEVHTYGHYLRSYAADVRAKSANLIFVTPVPRNYWSSETVTNNSVMAGYVGWMREVARSEGLPLLDLNATIVDLYTSMGRTAVSAYFTSGDNTHTNLLGASESARAVLEGVVSLQGSNLRSFLEN